VLLAELLALNARKIIQYFINNWRFFAFFLQKSRVKCHHGLELPLLQSMMQTSIRLP
jgi:hypothetical protein